MLHYEKLFNSQSTICPCDVTKRYISNIFFSFDTEGEKLEQSSQNILPRQTRPTHDQYLDFAMFEKHLTDGPTDVPTD